MTQLTGLHGSGYAETQQECCEAYQYSLLILLISFRQIRYSTLLELQKALSGLGEIAPEQTVPVLYDFQVVDRIILESSCFPKQDLYSSI